MIRIYSPEECMQFCTPCFGGWDLKFKDIEISGVYINEDQTVVTKEMVEKILGKIEKFFPLYWADTDILCLPFRPMLKKNGQWTGTDYNGRAWKGIIALGAQRDIATHLFASSMILHELWHEFAYQFIDATPFNGLDTPQYRKFKEIMGITDYKDNDIIWEDRPSEILAELGRYFAEDNDFTWEDFITFDDANDPKPLREAYDYLMSFMPPKPEEVPIMRDINLLHPALISKAKKLIELAKAKGIDIIISQTWRTKDEQDELYAQGRTKPGQIVTNVKYPYSLHCWGVALDVAVIVGGKANWDAKYYNIVGPLGESLGLEWGGRWKSFVDRPHFQLPGIEVTDLIRKHSTPDNYKKSWSEPVKEAKVVAGFEGPAKVVYAGKELSAGILEGKTFVELRALAELLGLKVAWDNATKTVTLS